jgi:hypothetical protein
MKNSSQLPAFSFQPVVEAADWKLGAGDWNLR